MSLSLARRQLLTTDSPLTALVRTLELYSELGDDDRRALCDLPYTLRSFEPHGYAVREGERPTQCMVLLSGFAYRQKSTRDGSRQIISIHMPGEPLDLQHLYLDEADHSVQALTRIDVAMLKRSDIRALMAKHPVAAEAIVAFISIEGSIFRKWVLNVGRRNARSRVAHLLCEFALRLECYQIEQEYRYELPMTQEQLADATGLTPVHINRTLRSLAAEGLLAREKRFIILPDWERLRQVADFNPRYLHLRRRELASL